MCTCVHLYLILSHKLLGKVSNTERQGPCARTSVRFSQINCCGLTKVFKCLVVCTSQECPEPSANNNNYFTHCDVDQIYHLSIYWVVCMCDVRSENVLIISHQMFLFVYGARSVWVNFPHFLSFYFHFCNLFWRIYIVTVMTLFSETQLLN